MKEQKYHIYLTEQERSEVIKSLIDLKNTLIRQGKYTDAVDDVLVKLTGYEEKFYALGTPIHRVEAVITTKQPRPAEEKPDPEDAEE